jgi:hypothetical protein
MGPNDARRVDVWAICKFFSFFFHVFLILTNLLYYIKALSMTERLGMGDGDDNGPKRRVVRLLSHRYVLFVSFYTN